MVLAIAGCGGGTGGTGQPAACTSFSACGGDLVGAWNITTACRSDTMLKPPMTCQSASFNEQDTASGTLQFSPDGRYTVSITAGGTVNAVLPHSCLNGVSCSRLSEQRLPAGYSSVTCWDDGVNCNCTFAILPTSDSANGTYAASGASLTLTPTGGSPGAPALYCASGGELSIQVNTSVLVASKK